MKTQKQRCHSDQHLTIAARTPLNRMTSPTEDLLLISSVLESL
jgi:hypothetical protein